MKRNRTFRPATLDDAAVLAELINYAGEGMPLYLWGEMVQPGEAAWDVGRRRAAREQGSFSYRNATIIEHNGQCAGCLIGYEIPDNPGLTPDEAKAKGPDFYAEELKERLAKGPLVFDLVAITGKTGDQTSDPTLRWDDEDNRATTPLGKISITAIAPQETCDAGVFLPGNVTDGITGPPDDPIFAVRSPAYIVSFTRRKAAP
jgi:hypothetical protein